MGSLPVDGEIHLKKDTIAMPINGTRGTVPAWKSKYNGNCFKILTKDGEEYFVAEDGEYMRGWLKEIARIIRDLNAVDNQLQSPGSAQPPPIPKKIPTVQRDKTFGAISAQPPVPRQTTRRTVTNPNTHPQPTPIPMKTPDDKEKIDRWKEMKRKERELKEQQRKQEQEIAEKQQQQQALAEKQEEQALAAKKQEQEIVEKQQQALAAEKQETAEKQEQQAIKKQEAERAQAEKIQLIEQKKRRLEAIKRKLDHAKVTKQNSEENGECKKGNGTASDSSGEVIQPTEKPEIREPADPKIQTPPLSAKVEEPPETAPQEDSSGQTTHKTEEQEEPKSFDPAEMWWKWSTNDTPGSSEVPQDKKEAKSNQSVVTAPEPNSGPDLKSSPEPQKGEVETLAGSAAAAKAIKPDIETLEEWMQKLTTCVARIVTYFSVAKDVEQRVKLGDDTTNPKIARVVRGNLCMILYRLLNDCFKVRKWWGSQNHFWDFVQASVEEAKSAVQSYAVLQLIASVKELDSNKQLTNPDMIFRSWVCLGLSTNSLHDWINILFRNARIVDKYYERDSFMLSFDNLAAVTTSLCKLKEYPFKLDPNFEL
eukprot:TRINITY_DN21_c0_g1_i1.p1 TRINITY_DN21_c0_g1~~TRINITY_DN21_c0_g1_i1.p1  ORF type:complete len:675 (+),score=171.27 TRINITY_DN21_c0_g1_i1:248-2026(+)